MRRDLNAEKGFTLVEVLIATAIFAFAMSGILLMVITCASLDEANRNKSIATTHAEFVMEDIMGYMENNELSSLQTKIDSEDEDVNLNWGSDKICSKLGCTSPCVYPWVLNSEEIETSYVEGTNPLEITVTVSWKDRAQVDRGPLELKTLISKR